MHKGGAHLFFKLRKLTAQRRLANAQRAKRNGERPASQIALKLDVPSRVPSSVSYFFSSALSSSDAVP